MKPTFLSRAITALVCGTLGGALAAGVCLLLGCLPITSPTDKPAFTTVSEDLYDKFYTETQPYTGVITVQLADTSGSLLGIEHAKDALPAYIRDNAWYFTDGTKLYAVLAKDSVDAVKIMEAMEKK